MERECVRCGTKMIKGYKLKLNFKIYDTVITKIDGKLFNTVGKPDLSICPACGEISMYLENFQNS